MSEQSTTTEPSTALDRGTIAKVAAGFVVAALIIYLFGRVIGWSEILRTLGNANLFWVAVACLSSGICLVIWTKSWDVTLSLVDVDIPFRSLVPTYFAATFADYVTPFGRAGGGPFIAYILSTDDRASYQESFASVLAADMLNLIPFFTFAGIGFAALAVQGGIPAQAHTLLWVLGVLALGLPILLYLSWRKRDWVERIVVAVVKPISNLIDYVDVEDVRERVDEFYDRLDIISGHPKQLAYTLLFAYGGWLFFTAPLYMAARALGVPINPLLVLFIVPASSLAGVVPTPGGLGGVEAALVGLLVALTSLSPELAAAVALLYRVASYWFVVAVGGIAALYETYGA